ncbi:MAG: FAD-dependent oxidoreductase [bacterium]
MQEKYDTIIVGGGPAAISAGIYLARKKVSTLLIAKEWGGQVSKTNEIENYLGFESIRGSELSSKMIGHLKKYSLDIQEGVIVEQIKSVDDSLIKVTANDQDYQAKTLIVATGGVPRKLGVSGEKEFSGKGVTYCSICDAPLFKNKGVVVVGSGNSGLEAALDLTKYASKIYLLEVADKLGGDKFLQDRIKKENKIQIITSVSVKEISGDKFVSGLTYKDRQSGNEEKLDVQGVFVEIGWLPNSILFENVVELNERKEIKIDKYNQTSAPNIFAAGDVTDVSHKQLVIAAGEGAKAALNVYDYILNIKK